MLEKLRRRFVLDSLLYSTLLLVIGVSLLTYVSYRYENTQMKETMIKALAGITDYDSGSSITYADTVPYNGAMLAVVTDKNNNVITKAYTHSNLNYDDEDIQKLVNETLKQKEKNGILSVYSLMYMREPFKGGYKIVFADRTALINSIQFQMRLYIVFAIMAILMLMFIAEFMAKKAVAPVAQSIKDQQRFIADASHELKTPLTVIMANLDIVDSTPDSTVADVSKWLENTKSEAMRMQKLVNEMLFLARSDAAINQNYEFALMNLSDVVVECALSSEALAFERKIAFSDDIDEEVQIIGDADKIKQVIMILLDNAFKYVNEGGSIDIALKSGGTMIKSAVLSVHNTGDAIPPEKIDHVFERFYRVDESRVREKDGYGLGLSIAQNIVEKHSGEIIVAYSNENGTCFEVSFPAPLSPKAPIIKDLSVES